MAQQFVRDGDEVELLAIWDTYPGPAPVPSLLHRLRVHARRFLRASASGRYRQFRGWLEGITRRLAPGLREKTDPSDERTDWYEANQSLIAACHRAGETYRPRPYPGRILLCRSDRRPDWEEFFVGEPYARWNPLARGGVDLRNLDTEHLKLLKEPHVSQLSTIMDSEIRVLDDRRRRSERGGGAN
jgi:thioesterase domain-containing protein